MNRNYINEHKNICTIQRLWLKKLFRRNYAARIIQRGCLNWLWKPICNDGKYGIKLSLAQNKHSVISFVNQIIYY